MVDGSNVTSVTPPESDEVRTQVERLLATEAFSRSDSLSRFLRFVVEETLAGKGKQLKARTIAIKALDRDNDFDPQKDPIVRIQAGRLRRLLEEYYEEGGVPDPIHIELPKGRYEPTFSRVNESLTTTDIGKPLIPHGPSVAVVPFIDLDANGVGDYFGVGLTQELITVLTTFQELTVIAVPSTKTDSVNPPALKLGAELGVRFVLSGAFRRSAETLLLRFQLIDSASDAIVWAEKIKCGWDASELFDLEEQIAQRVATTIAENYGVIPRTLTSELNRKQTRDLSVYEAILRFRHYQCVVTNEARDSSIAALERAIEQEPNYALAWAMLAETIVDAYGLRIDCRTEVVSRSIELARRAIALDPNCQHAYWSLALAHFHARERCDCLKAAETTIELNPNNGYLVASSAWVMALMGERNRGLKMLSSLMNQNPHYPTWLHLAPFLDHYHKEEFGLALDHANKFNIPELAWDPILRAAALGQLGRRDEARTAVDELNANFPNASANPAFFLRGYIFLEEEIRSVVDGLKMAGWQEGMQSEATNAQ